MKPGTHRLIFISVIILSSQLGIAYADGNGNNQNPWSPSYHSPRYTQYNTQQRQPGYTSTPGAQYPPHPQQPNNSWQQPSSSPQPFRPGAHRYTTNQFPPYNSPAINRPTYNLYNAPYYNNRWGNRWNNYRNNAWGRSGPERWMNPNKRNLAQDWNDMLNAPSRMGTMPGGWSAPSVSMPNPVNVSNQFENNARRLPDQMQNMNMGH